MPNDAQFYFNILIAGGGIVVGWYVRLIWSEIKLLRQNDKDIVEKVAAIEVLVAGEYVKRDWFEAKMDALFRALDRINDKLDHKADK